MHVRTHIVTHDLTCLRHVDIRVTHLVTQVKATQRALEEAAMRKEEMRKQEEEKEEMRRREDELRKKLAESEDGRTAEKKKEEEAEARLVALALEMENEHADKEALLKQDDELRKQLAALEEARRCVCTDLCKVSALHLVSASASAFCFSDMEASLLTDVVGHSKPRCRWAFEASVGSMGMA